MAENVRILLKEEEVDKRIAEVAAMINRDYAGKEVHLICILKGGVFFTCELAKRLTVPVSMDFMSVSSYGSGTESSGVVRIVKDLDESIAGKNVLIVEDKRLTVPVSMDFMSVSSYGSGTESSGVVRIVKDLDESIAGKNVLIVEDIIDSGRTLAYLIEILKQRNPSSILAGLWPI